MIQPARQVSGSLITNRTTDRSSQNSRHVNFPHFQQITSVFTICFTKCQWEILCIVLIALCLELFFQQQGKTNAHKTSLNSRSYSALLPAEGGGSAWGLWCVKGNWTSHRSQFSSSNMRLGQREERNGSLHCENTHKLKSWQNRYHVAGSERSY